MGPTVGRKNLVPLIFGQASPLQFLQRGQPGPYSFAIDSGVGSNERARRLPARAAGGIKCHLLPTLDLLQAERTGEQLEAGGRKRPIQPAAE